VAIVCLPKMLPVPKNATPQVRERMYCEYVAHLAAANRHLTASPIGYFASLLRMRKSQP
jgi:hypothetical protein